MEYSKVIRSNYAGMDDEALMDLWNDRHGLTPEALNSLREELQHRELLSAENFHPEWQAYHTGLRNALEEKHSRTQLKELWRYLVNLAAAGQGDAQIINSLKQKGLNEEEALFMFHELPAATLQRINDADHDRLGALIRLCCGIAVLIITMLASLGKAMYFVGWITIAISIVQTAIASSARSRYQQLLSRLIRPEDEEGEDQEL